jgi:YcxB-like protein
MAFEVEITYESVDYARAARFMFRGGMRILTLLIVVGSIVFAVLLYRAYPASFEWWVIPVIIVMLIFFLWLIRLAQNWSFERQLKSAPSAQGSHQWVFDDEGITIAGSLATLRVQWGAITKAEESKDDIFLYQAKQFAHFVPKRVFKSEQEMKDLKTLLIAKLGRKAHLS